MKKFLFTIPLLTMLIIACSTTQKHTEMAEESAMMDMPDPVEHGRYLTTIMGCHGCHTPEIFGEHGEMILDSTRFLSGHPSDMPYPNWTPANMEQRNGLTLQSRMSSAWAGPWGVSFAQNLTPDDSTGLGEWTEEAFIQAIRTGKHQGQPNGRKILSPMPWKLYRHATDEDLKAIWAYLRSIPSVVNLVPTPVPPDSTPAIEE